MCAVAAEHASDEEILVLEATLNGTATGQLLTLIREHDGGFRARADELRELRIKVDPAKVEDGMIRLTDLPGFTTRYDEARQSIDLRVPDGLLNAYRIGLGTGREAVDLSAIHPTPGAILNYGLYGLRSAGESSISGTAETIVMTPTGIVSSTGVFNSQHTDSGSAAVRLDSSWQVIDADRIRSYTVGDFATNALAWTTSTRLAGFQIASAFEQRPDLVTAALPEFSGSAALPSTLDLYVNQQRVFSGEIPSGPFDIRSLPSVSGDDVHLVTTDATGRQIDISQSYYSVPGQLRQGLFEYSLDVGVPRRNYGVASFDYDDMLSTSGSARYGLTHNTTLEGHLEASSDDLANGGVGIIRTIGGLGAVMASIETSNYKGRSGAQGSVEFEGYLCGARLYASTQRASFDYFDIARVADLREASRLDPSSPDYVTLQSSTAQARAIDRAGVAFTPAFDRTSFNLSYSAIAAPSLTQRILNLTASRALSTEVSAYASGYADFANSRDYGVFFSLDIRLSSKVEATVGLNHTSAQTAYSLQVDGLAGQNQGDIGWSVTDSVVDGGDDQRSAYLTYRAQDAYLRAHIEQSGAQSRGGLDVEGSMVAAGGDVFLANRIGDGFVIVENAGPGSGVIQGGVPMGYADSAGKLLLPDVPPYSSQHIFIDPASTADGWELPATERVAVTGLRQGAVVDFGASFVRAAIVVLQDKDGKPIPPGYTLQLEGGGTTAVGYDGEAYIRGLNATNRLSIDLGPRGICTAHFDYDTRGPTQPRLGPVVCQ